MVLHCFLKGAPCRAAGLVFALTIVACSSPSDPSTAPATAVISSPDKTPEASQSCLGPSGSALSDKDALALVESFLSMLVFGSSTDAAALLTPDAELSFSPDIFHVGPALVAGAGASDYSLLSSDWTFDRDELNSAKILLADATFSFYASASESGRDVGGSYSPGPFVWIAQMDGGAAVTGFEGNGKLAVECRTGRISRLLMSAVCALEKGGEGGVSLAPWVEHKCPGEFKEPAWREVG